jgi:DNA modification methylase
VNLYCGDCLDILPELPSCSFDMIYADLPYGTTQCPWDSIIDLNRLWPEYMRLIKPHGAIVLHAAQPFTSALVMSNPKWYRYDWVWEKNDATGHLNAKKAPLRAHESLLVFAKQGTSYNPIKTFGHKRKSATKRSCSTPVYGEQTFDSLAYDSTERYPRSVLKGPTDKQHSKLHPTQKPLWLSEYIVKTYTNEGGTVLDNTMGSGTAGVACKTLGRGFVGIEKDAEMFEIARSRIFSSPQPSVVVLPTNEQKAVDPTASYESIERTEYTMRDDANE